METIRRRMRIPADRELHVTLPPHIPVGEADVLVVISPVTRDAKEPTDFSTIAGIITLTEDPLEYQRRIRSEWE